MLARDDRRARTLLVRVGCLAALVLVAAGSPIHAAEGEGIAWRGDFGQAQAEARARNLPLWIQFTGPWCGYCRKMDAQTFPEPGIVARSQGQFVPVKLQSNAHENLVAQLGIATLPATVILSPSGAAILAQRSGFADPYTFTGLLDGAWANHTNSPEVLALGGMCPVRLVQGKGLKPGAPDLAVFHDGFVYRFADVEARDLFTRNPEKFIPSDRGRCVVARKEKAELRPGDPHFGVYYHDRLYLLADDDARRTFAADPDRYSSIDVADNGECPHCRDLKGEKVAGKPEFSSTLAGRRYLFPDATHRQAFGPSLERILK